MQKEYVNRRNSLLSKMPKNSFAIFFAGKEVRRSEDENYSFQVDHNFFYLTGINQENSILVLKKDGLRTYEYLFIDEFDAHKEVWTGIRLKVAECQNISGINNIDFTKNFRNSFNKILGECSTNKCELFLDFGSACIIDYEEKYENNLIINMPLFIDRILRDFPFIKIQNSNEILMKMRMIKSPYEIQEIRKAIDNTKHALEAILKALKPGMHEYDISSLFAFKVAEIENAGLAFNTIAASGKNGVILHYPHPVDELHDGDLILLDLGADNKEYKSDISRTYPINGHFSSLQKKIYEIVLECNKTVIKYAKPGITIYDLQNLAIEFMTGKLISEGLMSKKEEIRNYYYHNVSHHLGLDTHDLEDRKAILKPNMIITVEPGLYFKEYNIGIRIEDDVLITEEGCEVLSKDIIKEIDDIEKAMK